MTLMAEPITEEQLTAEVVADLAHLGGFLKPAEKIPGLWRLNGCGTTLLGNLPATRHGIIYFTRLFVTVLWVPIMPLGVFLVSSRGNSYDFHGQISPEDFHRIYSSGIRLFYLRALGHALAMIVAIIGFLAFAAWLSKLFGAHNTSFRLRL
jgi:hypothetical protein